MVEGRRICKYYADKECDALLKDGVPISSNELLFATCITNMSLFKFLLTLSNEKY